MFNANNNSITPISYPAPLKRSCTLREVPTGGENILLEEGKIWISIPIKNILFIKAEHIYARIFFVDNQQMLRRVSLTELMDVLPKDQFMQVHRSYIVNLDRVNRCDRHCLYVGKYTIPVSRRRQGTVLNRLQR